MTQAVLHKHFGGARKKDGEATTADFQVAFKSVRNLPKTTAFPLGDKELGYASACPRMSRR